MSSIPCAGVLAVELAPGASPVALTVPTEAAAALGDAVAHDLARLLPGVETLGLALAAALFDQAQLLRPGWPVFTELVRLHEGYARGRDAAQVMAFGTAGGQMASPLLVPDPALVGAPLLCLPFVLRGDPGTARAVGERMETVFGEAGLAGAAVSLFLEQALSMRVAHARYLTRHDLCALAAIQLGHEGLDAAWRLIEAALLAPGTREDAESPEGMRWALAEDGGVTGDARDAAAWCREAGAPLSPPRRADGYAAWVVAQRRHAALFAAHGLVPRYRDAAGGTLAADLLWRTRGSAEPSAPRRLHRVEAASAGLVAYAVTAGDRIELEAYPLSRAALPVLAERLVAACGLHPRTATAAPLALDAEGLVVVSTTR